MIQKSFAVFRDFCLLALGMFGTLHQELTGQVNPALLVVYAGCMGIPAVTGLTHLLRGGSETTPGTTKSSSESPSREQGSRSSSPS